MMTLLVLADYISKSLFPNRVKDLLWTIANFHPKWMNMLPELTLDYSDLLDRDI